MADGLTACHSSSMRQPCHSEVELAPAQDLAPDVSYAACLTEDVQLFTQLGDLEAISDELLLPATANLNLVQLATGAPAVEAIKPRSGRAVPTKRQARSLCDVCKRCFSDSYSLRIHKMTHTDERPHVCSVCGKGFRQLSKLRIHSVTHTDERPYECDICGKGFRFANYLTVHRRLHTGEKPYECTVAGCSRSFHSIHARRMHAKLQHAGTNELEQEQDQEQDQEQEQEEQTEMERHPNDDEGEKKKTRTAQEAISMSSLSYTCPICGRVLTDQCYLNTHMKRHFNQRDFACAFPGCGKRFFSSSELNHHQVAHTRLRPFRCSLCGSCFLRKSNYKQHLKVHRSAHDGD